MERHRATMNRRRGFMWKIHVACVAGVKRGKGRGNLGAQGARGKKGRNACKETIVFSIFQAQIPSVKIVIGRN